MNKDPVVEIHTKTTRAVEVLHALPKTYGSGRI